MIVDIEPVLVVTLRLQYPLHGYAHTFLVGALVGLVWATAAYPLRGTIGRAMRLIRLPYEPTYPKMALSGVLGVWLHVVFDSFLYRDIRPFFPLASNPLLGLLSYRAVYLVCELSFLPALALYLCIALARGGSATEARGADAVSGSREDPPGADASARTTQRPGTSAAEGGADGPGS